MKKKERKELKEILMLAIKKQLLDSNAEVTNKFEKTVKKSIKQLVKKARLKKPIKSTKVLKAKKVAPATKKIKKAVLSK
jgi:hypothetical protein